ncbi:hypothetical protein FPSE_03910 [Fusarium pseudograminearum CS3096]|uniref:Uncharacterized protein n=1 Tax=Fusarium pseudograminearum (strain CS3096) TaxID=1028729 RepID=K3VLW6_FUSPC|nr:hypothetical protein FPSE_03910 [Fusarium pseudograminearum CS3096]EKJ75962.1 hypothetical protein FPSE_03910 [Fusarium pseudograminearum CS3096]
MVGATVDGANPLGSVHDEQSTNKLRYVTALLQTDRGP